MKAFVFKSRTLLTLYAALVAFCLYTAVFAFRKAFNVAPFEGEGWAGLPYKVLLIIAQVGGYMASKFYGIKFIAELKRLGRGRLLLILVGISWFAWLLFALVPRPYNAICLVLNGFPLGMIWGIVFSYVEGRKTTDIISAALAVSFIFASGLAKTVALWLMVRFQVSEFWMPFATGAIFFPPLLLMVWLMEKLPDPDQADTEAKAARVPMSGPDRSAFIRQFLPGVVAWVGVYVLVTILREVRDSFLADMWRESGETFSPSVFTRTETFIALSILCLIAAMVWVKDNYTAFQSAQWMMLGGMIIAMVGASRFREAGTMFQFTTWVGLGLYLVYIPFNSILFDRFLPAFRITGNVGFLIYIADAFGYLGSVLVLMSKSVLKLELNWLSFYRDLVMITGIVGLVLILFCIFYFHRKKRLL